MKTQRHKRKKTGKDENVRKMEMRRFRRKRRKVKKGKIEEEIKLGEKKDDENLREKTDP